MSVVLRPEFPKPQSVEQMHEALKPHPHRIPISGAKPTDIVMTANSVDLIFSMMISALQGHLENLRENLPVSSLNNFKDIYNQLCDLRSETLGRLEELGDQIGRAHV